MFFGNGNPNDELLSGWLTVIKNWSEAHSDHAPITLVLDIKDDLTDNRSVDDGNLGALNQLLINTFQGSLFPAHEMGVRGSNWPSIEALKGKVIPVLSGREQDRQAYRFDEGHNPAIALNTNRQVVEVHDDGQDDLWYWNGLLDTTTNTIQWTGHGRYDSGRYPAVTINDQGVVVEVHRSESARSLWYRVGQLRADGTGIDFGDSDRFDSGVFPSVRFINQNTVREVHQSQNNSQRWYHIGTVNPVTKTIQWTDHDQTNDSFYNKAQSTATITNQQWVIGVRSRETDDQLRYTINTVNEKPIQYRQIAFVESQMEDDEPADEQIHFFAAEASDDNATGYVNQWHTQGGIVRLWSYNQVQGGVSPHFPATDYPFATWYLNFMRNLDAVDLDD